MQSDFPYKLQLDGSGAASTLGHHSYGGALKRAFTAHPKPDPVTGNLLNYILHI